MLNWFLPPVFDELDCVVIDNGQDLWYKKLDWFLECQTKVSYILRYNYKNVSGLLNAGTNTVR